MAQVPYSGVPEVSPDSRPPDGFQRIEANPRAFGASIAQGVERLGQGTEQAGENFFNTAKFQGRVNVDYGINNFIDAKNGIVNKFTNLEGADAASQQEDHVRQLKEAREQIRDGLKTPFEKLEFETASRRMSAEAESHMMVHAAQQRKVWSAEVQGRAAEHSINEYVNNLDNLDPEVVKHHAADFVNFRLRQAQLKFGFDPEIEKNVTESANRELLKARIDRVAAAPGGAAKAMEILKGSKNIAGTQYDDWYGRLHAREINDTGEAAANQAVAKATATGIGSVARPSPSSASFLRQRSSARIDGINPVFADRLVQAASDFERDNPGKMARFESLNRSHEEQARLYERYRTGRGGLAAPPGQSRHEYGLAADVPEGAFLNWLHDNGSRYGLEFLKGRAFINDSGHVQMAGGQVAVPQAGLAAASQAAAAQPPSQAANASAAMPVPTPVSMLAAPLPPVEAPGGVVTVTPPHVQMPVAETQAPSLRMQLAAALSEIINNPDLDDDERRVAEAHVQQKFRVLALTEEQGIATRKMANDNAALGFTTKLGQLEDNSARAADYLGLLKEINDNQDLDFKTKHELRGWVEASSGGKVAKTWGAGYWDVFQAVHAPEGDPGKITDPDQLLPLVRPGGPLTPAGYKELVNEIRDARSPQGQADAMAKKDFLEKVARPQITSSNPELKIYSEKGETNFLRFQIMFNSMYAKGKAAGLTTAQMLDPDSKEYLGKLIAPFKMTDADSFLDALKDKNAPPSWWGGRLQALRELDAAARAQMAPPPFDASNVTSKEEAVPPPFDASNVTSKEEVKRAYDSRRITREEATKILMDRGWATPAAPVPQVPISAPTPPLPPPPLFR